jgi:hypothetical protein
VLGLGWHSGLFCSCSSSHVKGRSHADMDQATATPTETPTPTTNVFMPMVAPSAVVGQTAPPSG